MYLKRSIQLLVISALLVLTASGQTPGASPEDSRTDEQKKEEAKAKLTAQAYDLLDAVIKDIQSLRLPQNRVSLSVTVAEILWQNDEKAARLLFKDAIADLRAILNEPTETTGPRAIRQRMERAQLREAVLLSLAPHDSRLALDLLAETRPPAPPKDEYPPDNEAELETRVAAIIAANDPTQAIDIARKSLAKGISQNLPTLLSEIREKDPVAAAELAGDILAKLKTSGLTTDQDAARVAVRIFEMATSQAQAGTKSATKEAKPLLTEPALRELAELIAAAALDSSAENSGRTPNIGTVMAQLEKYAPSRAQQLRRKYAQPAGEGGTEPQSYQDLQRLISTGTAEDLIAAAEKLEPELRDQYYRNAALKLAADDKIDQARQVITAHVTNPEQRQQMLAELDKQMLVAAASKGKMEETRKLISTASTDEERITILTQLATAVAEKGDKKSALQILEEARNLSLNRPRYFRQLVSRLEIARAYASVDASQSFAILEPSIDQLNELLGAGILLGEFFGEEELVKDDELMISFVGQFVGMFQQQFVKDVVTLATADFARTRNAAERFQRFEVRILARILVVQAVLGPEKVEKGIIPQSPDNSGPAVVSP